MIVQAAGSAAATSVTLPGHQAGDMIIIAARGTAAAPSVPAAGGTVPAWTTLQTGIANSLGLTVVAFVATASNHTSGVFTNATHLGVIVLRPTSGSVLSTAAARSSVGNGNNTQTIIYPALTLADADGSSMGVRIGTRTVAIASVGNSPTNWINQFIQPATPLMSGHTRLALVANPVADTVSTTGTNAAYRAVTIEILEVIPQTVAVPGVGSPQAFGVPTTRIRALPAGVPSAQAFGAIIARAKQFVPVGSVYPFGYAPSITGQVISGDGHLVGGTIAGQFGAITATFVAPQTKPVPGLSSAQAFGAPAVKTAITRAPLGVSSAQAFGTPTPKTVIRATPASVPSAQAFGPVLIQQGAGQVNVFGLGSAQAFGAPIFKTGAVPAASPGVPSAQAFGALRFLLVVPFTGLSSAQAFGLIKLTYRAPVGGVASAQQFGVVSTLRAFTVAGAGSAQAFGVVKGRYLVQAQGLASAQSFGLVTPRTGRVIVALAGLQSEQAFGALQALNVWLLPVSCATIDLSPVPAQAAGLLSVSCATISLSTVPAQSIALQPAPAQASELEPVVCK